MHTLRGLRHAMHCAVPLCYKLQLDSKNRYILIVQVPRQLADECLFALRSFTLCVGFASNMSVDKATRRKDLGEWKKQFTRIRQRADQGLGR